MRISDWSSDVCSSDLTPLVRVRIKVAGAIHLARRAAPVETEGEWEPARLRAQFFLTDVVRPAAARLADAAAHHEQRDDAAIAHVHMIPVIETGAENDHRAAAGLLRRVGELARDLDDRLTRSTRHLLGPGGGEGHVVVIALDRQRKHLNSSH